jgi:hypothetical protein
MVDSVPSNGLAFSCRDALVQPSKCQRSRARSGQLQRRVGRARSVGDRVPIAQNQLLYGIVPRLDVVAHRGRRTVGEPYEVSGVCARFGALS